MWKKVDEELPQPFEVVWIYWRDREVLLGCRIYEKDEALFQPPTEGWYSFEEEKCRWTKYWMRVKECLDKPSFPQ